MCLAHDLFALASVSPLEPPRFQGVDHKSLHLLDKRCAEFADTVPRLKIEAARRNVLVGLVRVALAAAIVWLEPGFASLGDGKLVFLAIFSLIHAMFFIFGVSQARVLDASRTYGQQLALSTETLISS